MCHVLSHVHRREVTPRESSFFEKSKLCLGEACAGACVREEKERERARATERQRARESERERARARERRERERRRFGRVRLRI